MTILLQAAYLHFLDEVYLNTAVDTHEVHLALSFSVHLMYQGMTFIISDS